MNQGRDTMTIYHDTKEGMVIADHIAKVTESKEHKKLEGGKTWIKYQDAETAAKAR